MRSLTFIYGNHRGHRLVLGANLTELDKELLMPHVMTILTQILSVGSDAPR